MTVIANCYMYIDIDHLAIFLTELLFVYKMFECLETVQVYTLWDSIVVALAIARGFPIKQYRVVQHSTKMSLIGWIIVIDHK